jgi:hypothetical protein
MIDFQISFNHLFSNELMRDNYVLGEIVGKNFHESLIALWLSHINLGIGFMSCIPMLAPTIIVVTTYRKHNIKIN